MNSLFYLIKSVAVHIDSIPIALIVVVKIIPLFIVESELSYKLFIVEYEFFLRIL